MPIGGCLGYWWFDSGSAEVDVADDIAALPSSPVEAAASFDEMID